MDRWKPKPIANILGLALIWMSLPFRSLQAATQATHSVSPKVTKVTTEIQGGIGIAAGLIVGALDDGSTRGESVSISVYSQPGQLVTRNTMQDAPLGKLSIDFAKHESGTHLVVLHAGQTQSTVAATLVR